MWKYSNNLSIMTVDGLRKIKNEIINNKILKFLLNLNLREFCSNLLTTNKLKNANINKIKVLK